MSNALPAIRTGCSNGNDQMIALNITGDHHLSLIKLFRGFPQSLHTNARTVPGIGHDVFVPNPFLFIPNLTIDAIDL
jgi:hypothetical protein